MKQAKYNVIWWNAGKRRNTLVLTVKDVDKLVASLRLDPANQITVNKWWGGGWIRQTQLEQRPT